MPILTVEFRGVFQLTDSIAVVDIAQAGHKTDYKSLPVRAEAKSCDVVLALDLVDAVVLHVDRPAPDGLVKRAGDKLSLEFRVETNTSGRHIQVKDLLWPFLVQIPKDDLHVKGTANQQVTLLDLVPLVPLDLPADIHHILLMLTVLPERSGLDRVVEPADLLVLLLVDRLLLLFRLLLLLVFLSQVVNGDHFPNFHHSVFAASREPIATRRELGDPNWFLVSSDILHVKVAGG